MFLLFLMDSNSVIANNDSCHLYNSWHSILHLFFLLRTNGTLIKNKYGVPVIDILIIIIL